MKKFLTAFFLTATTLSTLASTPDPKQGDGYSLQALKEESIVNSPGQVTEDPSPIIKPKSKTKADPVKERMKAEAIIFSAKILIGLTGIGIIIGAYLIYKKSLLR